MDAQQIAEQRPKVYVRYLALMFMSLMGFGNYFVFDLPGALQEKITNDMSVSTAQYSLLYSLYSWPNVILCFFGGYLTDKVFGIRWGAIIFCTIILISQFLIALGAFLNMFWLMCLGRFVFGIGGESLAVAQNTYAVKWFKAANELNLVFGFQISFSRVGSSTSFYLVMPIYEFVNNYAKGYQGLSIVILIASITCVGSLVSAIILAIMDKKQEKRLGVQDIGEDEKIKLTDVKNFPLNFWILSLICVMCYLTVIPFVGLSQVYFKRKYHLDIADANIVNSCIYIVSAIFSPICGFLVDRTGRNIIWISLGTILTCIAHFIVAMTQISPWFCTILMGIGYSILASALWPMVSLIIPPNQLNTAYGMMQAIQNLGLGLASMGAGWIVDYKGYIMLENVFLMSLSLTLVLIVICIFVDARDGYILNMSANERKSLKDKMGSSDEDQNSILNE